MKQLISNSGEMKLFYAVGPTEINYGHFLNVGSVTGAFVENRDTQRWLYFLIFTIQNEKKKLSLSFANNNLPTNTDNKVFKSPRLISGGEFYFLTGKLCLTNNQYFAIAKFRGQILYQFPHFIDNDLIQHTLTLFDN
jgi:hypothetical protein